MTGLLMDAWWALLDGISVPVYRIDVPMDYNGNYVVIRPETTLQQNNKDSFVDEVVVIVDIVTGFNANIDASVVESIDDEIAARISTKPFRGLLPAQSGVQISNVRRESSNYLQEENNYKKFYRKVSRYNTRLVKN